MTYSSRPTLNATRARQGRWGRHMLWVLLFGTLLAMIGLFGAWTWEASDFAAANVNNDRSEAAAFQAPEPAAQAQQGGGGSGAPKF